MKSRGVIFMSLSYVAAFLLTASALAKDITTVECTLSDGTEISCFEITVIGTPENHDVGSFCPMTTLATEDEVGI